VLISLQFGLAFSLVSTGLFFGSIISSDIAAGGIWLLSYFVSDREMPFFYWTEGAPLAVLSWRIWLAVRYIFLFFLPGGEYSKCWGDIFAHVVPVFQNYKETIPVTYESFFENAYARYNQTALFNSETFATLPSPFVSFIFMLSFSILKVLLAIYLIKTSFGANGYELSFSYIFKISYWFQQKEESDKVVLENITKVYAKETKPALDNINFSFEKGNVYVLLGSNGAGKSTICGVITGLFSADSGSATVLGYSLEQLHYAGNKIGIRNQHTNLIPNFTAIDNIQFYA
jgi:hypothetical protein